jgi:hypothetical protein
MSRAALWLVPTLALAASVYACTEGATPDCADPKASCGLSVSEAGAADARADVAVDALPSADASPDGVADAISDAPSDATDDGDAQDPDAQDPDAGGT